MSETKNNIDNRERLGEASFSVSARVAMQLGRESISSSIVAILELVKNAYDADAENVWIDFTELQGFEPSLVIQDDGTGMSLEQVKNNWMIIGTNNKVIRRSSSRKKRILVGEKGLGRLGLDRLSHQTKVQTFVADTNYGVELDINWRKYEDQATDRLEEISHNIYKIPKPIHSGIIENGTRLEIVGLNDTWAKSDIAKLYEELTLLISPFGGINDFAIWLQTDVPQLHEYNGRIESSQYLDAAEWSLKSTLTDDGYLIHQLNTHDGLEFSYEQHWSNAIRDEHTEDQPRCGPVGFELYWYDRSNTNAAFVTAKVRKFLNSNQGVRIYRDSFRVKPYGDPSGAGEGDWLNLNARRITNPAGVGDIKKKWNVAYNQVVGAAFITRNKNDELLDQTNREGIVESVAYYDLRRYILNAVEFFEIQRQKYARSQKKRRQIEETRENAQNKTKAVVGATNKVKEKWEQIVGKLEESSSSDTPINLEEIQEEFSESIRQLETVTDESDTAQEQLIRESEQQEQEYEEQKNTLGNLASLGILAAAFGHETVGYANEVISNIDLLRSDVIELFPILYQQEHHAVLKDVDKIDQAAHRINTFASFTLASVQRDKRKSREINLEQILRSVFKALDLENVYNIEVLVEFEEDFPKIKAFQIDWESIFINLITNAKWAIDSVRKTDNDRIIHVKSFRNSENIIIRFEDSGCGISPLDLERIYEPGFSTKRNQRGDVIGTGMGLAIVANFVIETYKGKILVEPESKLGGAEFTIELPLPPSKQR